MHGLSTLQMKSNLNQTGLISSNQDWTRYSWFFFKIGYFHLCFYLKLPCWLKRVSRKNDDIFLLYWSDKGWRGTLVISSCFIDQIKVKEELLWMEMNPYSTFDSRKWTQDTLFQRCTHFLYCSVLSLGGKVNTRRMSQSDMESIFTKIIYEFVNFQNYQN